MSKDESECAEETVKLLRQRTASEKDLNWRVVATCGDRHVHSSLPSQCLIVRRERYDPDAQGWKASTAEKSTLAVTKSTGNVFAFAAADFMFIVVPEPAELPTFWLWSTCVPSPLCTVTAAGAVVTAASAALAVGVT